MRYNGGPEFFDYAGWSGKASPLPQSRERAFQKQTPKAEACQTLYSTGKEESGAECIMVGGPSSGNLRMG